MVTMVMNSLVVDIIFNLVTNVIDGVILIFPGVPIIYTPATVVLLLKSIMI